ncbi:MAG: 4-hydroxy-tetrahydrodipicolinate synthase [Flavobacteriaceae bacterium]|nr:MAG: 4-hydroxy-tetrahydrodipicolinate synthase [Flavobacteriaceae bacterium]
MNKFFGTGVALVTPFNADKSVDIAGLERLVKFQISNGINYLVVLGTTGEPATLTTEEKELVKKTIIKANNAVLPLVLGIGGNNTAEVVEAVKNTDLSDFDAVLSVSPYYNRPSQEGIYQHFMAVGDACPKPLMIYNVPSRTGSNIEVDTVLRLANDCKNIFAVKEAAGDMVQAMALIQNAPSGFMVISGDDAIALPMTLAGGAGVISVIGQGLPEKFAKLIDLGLQNDAKNSFTLQYQILDSIELIFSEGNPAGIKAMLQQLDICSDEVRLPLVKASADLHQKIQTFIKNYK